MDHGYWCGNVESSPSVKLLIKHQSSLWQSFIGILLGADINNCHLWADGWDYKKLPRFII